jgi:uncharacterized membrane protein YesL
MSTSTTAGAPGTGWAVRLHGAFEWVTWIITVNALWYGFSLLGGVVLGVAPASAAAAELTRRRLRGEAFPALRSFARAWRREFVAANVALGPAFVITGMLGFGILSVAQAGALGTPIAVVMIGASCLAAAITTVAVSMFAHYDLPRTAYLVTASRFTLGNLPHISLLVLAAVVVVTASLLLPGLTPFVSLGAWITASTTLCVAFFAANDRRLAEAAAPVPTT